MNDYWRSSHRAVLGLEYHCLAEDLGHGDLDHQAWGHVAKRGEVLCKLVEYSSCDLAGTGLRWKPWHAAALLEGRPVCLQHPTAMFWRVHARWRSLLEESVHPEIRALCGPGCGVPAGGH